VDENPMMAAWTITAGGALAVAAVLVDIFHTLANPGRQGWLSRFVHRTTWVLSRRSAWSGPLSMLGVISIWGAVMVLGWALVYWPHMPQGFTFPEGSTATHDPTFVDALYLSLVTISTLGFGDVHPATDWLRIVNPLEALFGFALLTVVVTWVLQVYPALSRRRELALRLSSLQRAGTLDVLPDLSPAAAVILINGLAADITRAQVDMSDYAESYYFRENNKDAALPAMIGFAVDLGNLASASPHPDVHHCGNVLLNSLADFSDMLAARFLRSHEPSTDFMSAYARDHRHGPR
jgi:hypothetical protein